MGTIATSLRALVLMSSRNHDHRILVVIIGAKGRASTLAPPCARGPGAAAWRGMARSRVILESVYVLSERPNLRAAYGDRTLPELLEPAAGLEPATC